MTLILSRKSIKGKPYGQSAEQTKSKQSQQQEYMIAFTYSPCWSGAHIGPNSGAESYTTETETDDTGYDH